MKSLPSTIGRRAAVVAAGAAVLALSLAACGSGSSSVSQSYSKGSGVVTLVSSSQRKNPIQLAATTLDGQRLDLATLRGKPVVLNVWGSWCPPCRSEAKDLQAASQQLAGKASFVGLDVRDNVGDAKAFERVNGVTYPSLVDHGTLILALNGAVTSESPPVTLILDSRGRIAGRFVGPVTTTTLVDMVQDVTKTA